MVYLWIASRYVVELDEGAELVVVCPDFESAEGVEEGRTTQRGDMARGTTGPARGPVVALLAAVMLVAAGCGGGERDGGDDLGPARPPTATMPTLQSVGEAEGELNLIAWRGYVEDPWTRPFERETGCRVNARYAGSSDEMVSLMADGGGGRYDMVSASGDASLGLIYGGDVRPVNVELIPDFENFVPELQSPPHNTIDGVHYGVSLQWGPNVMLYNTEELTTAPSSWRVIYDRAYAGRITVPDNPIQIADAALYLSSIRPELGIEDPYELDRTQFRAAIDLLRDQRSLIAKHWRFASQEISMFRNGDAVVGAAWPYQTIALRQAGVPVAETIPAEGATGWADTWMLATDAPNENCAYLWMRWISTPKVQAQQAILFGETPVNLDACAFMDRLSPGACAAYHADAPASYLASIWFWKTPIADCGDGRTCVPYSEWQQVWRTELAG